MTEFVNTLHEVGPSPATDLANALFSRGLENNGTCSLFLGLSLTGAQCAQLFTSTSAMSYIAEYRRAETTILNGDPGSVNRLKLFRAGPDIWSELQDAGSGQNIVSVLKSIGIPDSAPPEALVPDVLTGVFWSAAMAGFAKALAAKKPLDKIGAQLVKAGTLGFEEAWQILAVRDLLGNPPIQAEFTSSLS